MYKRDGEGGVYAARTRADGRRAARCVQFSVTDRGTPWNRACIHGGVQGFGNNLIASSVAAVGDGDPGDPT